LPAPTRKSERRMPSGKPSRKSSRGAAARARMVLGGRLAHGLIWLCVVLAVGASTAFGLRRLESRVATTEESAQSPTTIRVRLSPVPSWMPWSLACHIAACLVDPNSDFNDPRVAQQTYERLCACPWVKSAEPVLKRRSEDPLLGIFEVKAAFREPFATVAMKDGRGMAIVDEDGVRLPDEPGQPGAPRWMATPPAGGAAGAGSAAPAPVYYRDKNEIPAGLAARPVQYMLIDGVAADAPPAGKKWPGQDLVDGIRLAQCLRGKPYADQIACVDVRNHGGRLMGNSARPHIVIRARGRGGEAVEVWFGRFPSPHGDYVLSVERRMANMEDYLQKFGGLFGAHRRVDLQYDRVHVE
jgi:hypothetical protein